MSTHLDPQSAPTEADENMAAWEAGVERMRTQLQARHPELFDESGELITEKAMKLITQAAEDQGLTLTELVLQASRDFQRRADAS
jgi:hypothetical protein